MSKSFWSLFCCPPLPSKIAEKLAFHPPEPSYSLQPQGFNDNMSFHPNAEYEQDFKSVWTEAFFTKTKRGHNIACVFLRCTYSPKKTILYSHGNAQDLGQILPFCLNLGRALQCNILSYDYSGYGQSEGQPSEKNLYADIEAAWSVLRKRYGLMPKDIVLYGNSIGTVPTMDLASKYLPAGVILHSPLMSGIRVLCPDIKRDCFFDSFVSTSKTPKIRSPVLVIHGTQDQVVDFENALLVYETCPKSVDPLWVRGAGHDDIEQTTEYIIRLVTFLNEELED